MSSVEKKVTLSVKFQVEATVAVGRSEILKLAKSNGWSEADLADESMMDTFAIEYVHEFACPGVYHLDYSGKNSHISIPRSDFYEVQGYEVLEDCLDVTVYQDVPQCNG
jgi:hypothetical protein